MGATSEKTAAGKAASLRVIKKYPNRRLYDTETSTYITLAEVRQLVMDSALFVVRDAGGGTAWMTFTIEVSDSARLSQVLTQVARIGGVRSARRK